MSLEEDKASLISVIEWYRDVWFLSNMTDTCNELIKQVQEATTEAQIEIVDRHVDDWFDY